MERRTTTELMRLLLGELPKSEADALRARLGQEPDLLREFESLRQQWQSLELPAPAAAPPGFATRVVARAVESSDQGLAPAWWSHTLVGKVSTALLLASGIALGSFLAAPSEAEDWSQFVTAEPSMAETYFLTLEEPEDETWQESDS